MNDDALKIARSVRTTRRVPRPIYHRCVQCGSEDRGERDWGLDHAQRCGGEVPRPPGWNRASDETQRSPDA